MEASSTDASHSLRAIVCGTAVIVGGSLMMTTILGIASICGLLICGNSPEAIAARLPGSQALALFAAAGGLLMNVCGGYAAATIVCYAPLRHALAAGSVAAIVTLAMMPLWGDSQPLAMNALVIAAIIPCAMLGAWLALPCRTFNDYQCDQDSPKINI